MLARLLPALLLVAACSKESPAPAGPGTAPSPGTTEPGTPAGAPAPPPTEAPAPPPAGTPAPPPAKPAPPGAGPKLGDPCGPGDACGEGSCVTYYGIAGPRGPAFKSCEIRCDAQRQCAGGRKCITVADGPGEVCR